RAGACKPDQRSLCDKGAPRMGAPPRFSSSSPPAQAARSREPGADAAGSPPSLGLPRADQNLLRLPGNRRVAHADRLRIVQVHEKVRLGIDDEARGLKRLLRSGRIDAMELSVVLPRDAFVIDQPKHDARLQRSEDVLQ